MALKKHGGPEALLATSILPLQLNKYRLASHCDVLVHTILTTYKS